MAYRVYVLKNRDGKLYIGFSENVALRVQQQNAGLTRSTRASGAMEISLAKRCA
jgi:predicted GIY-YIG superfamily endonuclease